MNRLILAILAFSISAQATHVKSYVRADGTVVQAYDRPSPKRTKGEPKAEPKPEPKPEPSPPHSYCTSCERDSKGRIERSKTAKDEFQRAKHCPSTGSASGACPGYVIDHINPLACGGADSPDNMQWQTVAAAKAKDRVERKGCQSR